MSEQGTIAVRGGNVVWYRNATEHSSRAPLVVIHGGPGVGSHYVKPFFDLSDQRPVITWDQLDNGRSDRPQNPELWTLTRFAEELDTIRHRLCAGPVHLLGHSFGSMVLMEWLSSTALDDVLSVTLASPCLSMADWKQDTDQIVASLSPAARHAIATAIETGDYASEEFEAANWDEYVPRCICRSLSSKALREMFADSNDDMMSSMWGPTDFIPIGTMRSYSRLETLPRLTMPVLFHCGQWDEAVPQRVEAYSQLCRDGHFAMAENSGHLTMVDDRAGTMKVIRDFLSRAESRD